MEYLIPKRKINSYKIEVKNMRKKFIKDVEAKIKPSLVIIMLIVAGLTAMLITNRNFVPSVSAASYTDFGYYKKITIDHNQVEATLTNFPVLVNDSTGDLLGKIENDANDVAFFDSTNSTQFYHEIEYYDYTNGYLWAWVNVTSVAADTDTVFYMFYGDSDGGYDVGYTPTSVWDSNYQFVIHLNQGGDNTTTRNDSTANGHDAEPYNYEGDEQTTGTLTGAGDHFDGSLNNRNDFLQVDTKDSVPEDTDFTIEVWMKTNNSVQTAALLSNNNNQNYRWTFCAPHNSFSDSIRWYAASSFQGSGSTSVADNDWHYLCIRRQSDWWIIFIDKDNEDSDPNSGNLSTTDYYRIGNEPWGTAPLDGWIDEVRVSNIARSNAWMNATYTNIRTPSTFMTLGAESEQTAPSSYSLNGLVEGKISWNGSMTEYVWCNSSGDSNEIVEINLSVNATDEVNEIRVHIGDLNETGIYINASNISIVFSSDNTTWSGDDGSLNVSAFTDGGSNVTITSADWSDENGFYGDNPFTDSVITDVTKSIWFKVRLYFPDGTTATTFYSESGEAWWVDIGTSS